MPEYSLLLTNNISGSDSDELSLDNMSKDPKGKNYKAQREDKDNKIAK